MKGSTPAPLDQGVIRTKPHPTCPHHRGTKPQPPRSVGPYSPTAGYWGRPAKTRPEGHFYQTYTKTREQQHFCAKPASTTNPTAKKEMTLQLLAWNVQHGSAIYIQTPNGKHIAIDLEVWPETSIPPRPAFS